MLEKSFIPSLLLLCVFCLANCKKEGNHDFNISEGNAIIRLNEFATQAKVEILVETSKMGDIHTNAVLGNMNARAALKIMLKGTPLTYYEDKKSQAFSIIISPENLHHND